MHCNIHIILLILRLYYLPFDYNRPSPAATEQQHQLAPLPLFSPINMPTIDRPTI